MADSLGDALLRTTLTLHGLHVDLPADLSVVNSFAVAVEEVNLLTVLTALVGALGLWTVIQGPGVVMTVDFVPRRYLVFSR